MLELLKMGGPMVWIILCSGAVAFAVFIERALHLHRARIRAEDFLKGVTNILRRGNTSEAVSICEETPGPVAHIVRTAILHRQDTRDDLQKAVDEAGLAEISRMERRLVVVSSVAQLAPLCGLLGTVIGMVEFLITLQQRFGLILAADLSTGLMHALTATATGLAVAILAHASFNLLVVKIDRLVLDMEKAGSDIVAFFTHSGPHAAQDTSL